MSAHLLNALLTRGTRSRALRLNKRRRPTFAHLVGKHQRPLSAFGPSVEVGERIYHLSDGLFLLVSAQDKDVADPSPYAVGWARCVSTAIRLWEWAAKGDDIDQPLFELPKPLHGWPEALTYDSIVHCFGESKRVRITAMYRIPQGDFIKTEVQASRDLVFYFDDPNPMEMEQPIGIQQGLSGRWPD